MVSWSFRAYALCFALLLLPGGCSQNTPASDTRQGDARVADAPSDGARDAPRDSASLDADAAVNKPTVRVLFIGNSYTWSNGLPAVLVKLGDATQSPVRFEVAQHTPGGARWEQHAVNPTVHQLIAQSWDTVVLQDQSAQAWQRTNWPNVKASLIALDDRIKKAGAKTLLFMTWARRAPIVPGDGVFEGNASLNNYYERHADVIKADVAPVGRAWAHALRDNGGLTLHTGDGSHPNAHGTYLAACVFYTSLTQRTPVGLGDGGLKNVSAKDRAVLQAVAWSTHVARLPAKSPALGVWPLSADRSGNDLIPQVDLVLGGVPGPKGKANGATQFGLGGRFGRFATIAYRPGLNTPRVTVAFHAHRSDWSVGTAAEQTLIARDVGYQITQLNTTLRARIDTVVDDTPKLLEYSVAALSAGWHHLALTYDGTTYALWVDAAQVASSTTSGDLRYYPWSTRPNPAVTTTGYTLFSGIAVGTAAARHIVGAEMYKTEPRFSGGLADVRLFGRALTKTELAGL